MKLTKKQTYEKIRNLKNNIEDTINIHKAQSKIKKDHNYFKKIETTNLNSQIQKIDELNRETKINPKIEIIIKHNIGENPKELLNSIYNQNYSNYHINFLTDDDVEYNDKRINILKINDYLNNLNDLISKSDADYLLFLESNLKFNCQLLNLFVNNITDNMATLGVNILTKDQYAISGVTFEDVNGIIKAKYITNPTNTKNEVIAVPPLCLFMKKQLISSFLVDETLKLSAEGLKSYILPTYIKINDKLSNIEAPQVSNSEKLKHDFYMDKLYAKCLYTQSPLTIAFVVTSDSKDTTAGDYFTALTLAKILEDKYHWNIKYLPQYPTDDENNWYFIDDDVDVIISLLDRYNINMIQTKSTFVKIAWLRNWFKRWCNTSYFKDYDIILASSMKACAYIKDKTSKDAHFYPLATDEKMFNTQVNKNKNFTCDYCFTGSYWGYKRNIEDCLNINSDYKFNLYGQNWEDSKLSKYSKGFIPYYKMPEVYKSTKIVVDDANHVTADFGSVNSRVFDATASGRLVITNQHIGNEELFGGLIPEYHTKNELSKQLNYYLKNPKKYQDKVKQLQKIVLEKHTYNIRAMMLYNILRDYFLNH